MIRTFVFATAASMASMALAAPPVPATGAPAAAEKRTCKRVVETGSFVKARKICTTPSERAAADARARATGREMQSLINSTNRGN